MTFWLVAIVVSVVFGLATGAMCRRTWIAVLFAALLGGLLAPYLGLRFVWDVTGHRDAQDGLAFLFGPMVTVPTASIVAYAFKRLRGNKRS
ncbi:hypothetical protein [uncultured Stenotrophomonas sp.]|uniref:hypothetical protein n=1 Tax=uncultured Stenotrophomonas sp. TaxID=165438 RepID=UPI0025F6210A|nr:hypothetical protein [uncultured Stenotrophomonas sp.]